MRSPGTLAGSTAVGGSAQFGLGPRTASSRAKSTGQQRGSCPDVPAGGPCSHSPSWRLRSGLRWTGEGEGKAPRSDVPLSDGAPKRAVTPSAHGDPECAGPPRAVVERGLPHPHGLVTTAGWGWQPSSRPTGAEVPRLRLVVPPGHIYTTRTPRLGFQDGQPGPEPPEQGRCGRRAARAPSSCPDPAP